MSLTRRSFTRSIARSLVTLVTLVTVAGLGACSDDSPTAAGGGVAGTYVLERVNGRALPYDFGGQVWEAMSITLTGDGKVSGSLRWRELDAAGATMDQGTESFSGTYTASGARLTIRIEDDEPVTAVLDRGTLTVTSDGDVLTFRRQ